MTPDVVRGAVGAVGRTPLIQFEELSEFTKCRILGKAEFLNPGGSVKDRIAAALIADGEATGRLVPGGEIVEATAGNTGIGLAMAAAARGYRTAFTVPAGLAAEKVAYLRLLGAEVIEAPDVPFSDERHFYHAAARLAAERGAFHADQFRNLANRDAHYRTTGPELWRQTGGEISALVAAAGTGGTLAGTGRYLKEQAAGIKVVLADPIGSALYSYVKRGVLAADDHDYIAEGIGIGRLVPNFEGAPVDDALQVTDRALVETAYRVLRREGLLLGMSAALNVWAAARVALRLGPGHTVVTVLPDGGERYRSKLYDPAWLAARDLTPRFPDLLGLLAL
ncbi:MAG: cysteine synthase A [Candidatus Sericytochromatia bacterium]|nr:cysteine synthase A [Candidatus Tanganyikabacteria bacterium]